jgi:hypothetical protein
LMIFLICCKIDLAIGKMAPDWRNACLWEPA